MISAASASHLGPLTHPQRDGGTASSSSSRNDTQIKKKAESYIMNRKGEKGLRTLERHTRGSRE